MLLEKARVAHVAAVALVVYAAFLALILLNPSADIPTTSVARLTDLAVRLHLPDQLMVSGRVEFLANAAILMPLPFLGSLIWARTNWRDWTAYAFVIASGVELYQGLFLPGRSATFVDVVANTLGGAIGAILVLMFRWVRAAW